MIKLVIKSPLARLRLNSGRCFALRELKPLNPAKKGLFLSTGAAQAFSGLNQGRKPCPGRPDLCQTLPAALIWARLLGRQGRLSDQTWRILRGNQAVVLAVARGYLAQIWP